jgi:ABC-type antimicrobial peptide transport system permease subunit
VEVAAIAVAGMLGSLVLVLALNDPLTAWSEQQFNVKVTLLDGSTAFTLLGATAALLVVGGVIPAVKASKIDPLEALEASGR